MMQGHHILELFPSHRVCWNYDPLLVALHTLADSTIAFSYFAIPAVLFYLARKYRIKRLSKIFVVYGLFILGCGVTHVFDVVTVWYANYWVYFVDGIVRALTGLVSLLAAYVTVKCTPFALRAFTRLAVMERPIRERLALLASDVRYDTPDDKRWGRVLKELEDLARQAREAVRTEEA